MQENTKAKRVEEIFRKFFNAFFKYQKYRKYCGRLSILSNPPRYRYFCHHYTTHYSQKTKTDETMNLCEMWIVFRGWFVMIREHFTKNFFVKHIYQGRWTFDKRKVLFLLCRTECLWMKFIFMKIAVDNEECVDVFSSCLAKLNFFKKK